MTRNDTPLLLLATDIASFIIKNRSPALRTRLSEVPPDRVAVSAVTRAELMYGLKRLPPAHRLHTGVNHFLRIVRVLPWDSDAADCYADIRHRLTAAGQPIGEMDMMIAGQALATGAVLVTNNARDFVRLTPPLVLANWQDT